MEVRQLHAKKERTGKRTARNARCSAAELWAVRGRTGYCTGTRTTRQDIFNFVGTLNRLVDVLRNNVILRFKIDRAKDGGVLQERTVRGDICGRGWQVAR